MSKHMTTEQRITKLVKIKKDLEKILAGFEKISGDTSDQINETKNAIMEVDFRIAEEKLDLNAANSI